MEQVPYNKSQRSCLQYDTPSPGLGRSKNTDVSARKKTGHSSRNLPPTSPKMSVVELKVPMCCEGCEENVRFELTTMEGVNDIAFDRMAQKVVIKGEVTSETILKSVKRVKNRAELWKN